MNEILKNNLIIDAFVCLKIIKTGHFKLTSGRHSDTYIQKDLIHLYPKLYGNINSSFCNLLENFNTFDIVTGPPLAGTFFAKTVALECNKPFIYPEKINGEIVLKRGFNKFIKNKRILIIEDIITTGGSIEKLIKILEDNEAIVSEVLCIWNRQEWNKYNCKSIIKLTLNDYSPDDCPLCKKGFELIDPKENK